MELSVHVRRGRVDLLLGRIALARRLITPDQLREALAEQAAGVARGRKLPRRLGVILIEKKFLTEPQLEALLEEQEARLIRDSVLHEEDALLGEVLIRRGFRPAARVNEALEIQAQAIDRLDDEIPRLGDLLVGKGLLEPDRLREALAGQRRRVLACRLCLKPRVVEDYEPGREYRCPRCQNPLAGGGEAPPAPPAPAPPEAVILTRRLPAAPGPPAFGKYEILREVGRGAMGVVYQARDVPLDRPVALKLMLAQPHQDPEERRVEEERFVREARLAARLPKHPGIVSIYEAGVLDGKRYIAMEFVDGRPFSDWRRQGSVTVRQQVQVIRDVALAVHHAHRNGVLHRDLKPANILVDAEGRACVTDFGLAKGMGKDVQGSLTAMGMTLGTPLYMSPEQARGSAKVDARADVWSLGVMLYEAMAGRPPFAGQSPMEVLIKVVEDPVVPPSARAKALANNPSYRSLEEACLKALQKNPRDRFPTAKALADELTRWLRAPAAAPPPPPRPKAAWWRPSWM